MRQLIVLLGSLALSACGGGSGPADGQRGQQAQSAPSGCPDAASPMAPRRDAGPACVVPGGGVCPSPSADAAPPPDPAHWLCYVDSDCAVFPDEPFCDGRHCSGPRSAVSCVANATDNDGLPSPEVAHTFTGANGTFSDHCDADGNLVAYECDTKEPPCGPGQNGCDGPLVYTGQALPLSAVVDCAGACRGGRCDGRCPQQGDQVTFRGEDATGNLIVHNDSDGRAYACALDANDQHGTNFDCGHVPAGRTGFIAGRSVADQHCTGAAFGNIAVVVDGVPTPPGLDTCGYLMCAVRPTSSCF